MFMRSNGKITPKIRDYFAEPLSHWTSHSHGNPALRASNVTGDELRPLSSDGESGFTGCSIPRFRRQATRSRDHDDRETNTVSPGQNSAIENTSHYLRRFFCRGVAEPTGNSSRGAWPPRVTAPRLFRIDKSARKPRRRTLTLHARLSYFGHDVSRFGTIQLGINLCYGWRTVPKNNASSFDPEFFAKKSRSVVSKLIRRPSVILTPLLRLFGGKAVRNWKCSIAPAIDCMFVAHNGVKITGLS